MEQKLVQRCETKINARPHILSPDVHPGSDEPYVSVCMGELITLLGCKVQLKK